MLSYCYNCGSRLLMRELDGEGQIPYCESCKKFIFPIFSCAVSMIVQSCDRERILLISQYGSPFNILVAGYINKGESAEDAVRREVMEETGLSVGEVRFNKSEYFPPSETLMLNFSCVAETDDLSGLNTKEVDSARWFTRAEALENIKPGSLAKKFLTCFLEKEQ